MDILSLADPINSSPLYMQNIVSQFKLSFLAAYLQNKDGFVFSFYFWTISDKLQEKNERDYQL